MGRTIKYAIYIYIDFSVNTNLMFVIFTVDLDRQKSCIRQQSAPHFNLGRRMTSKMNLGAFSNIFPGEIYL